MNDLTMIKNLLEQMTDKDHRAEIVFSLTTELKEVNLRARVAIKREGSTFQNSIIFTGDNDNLGMAYHLEQAVRECNKMAKT